MRAREKARPLTSRRGEGISASARLKRINGLVHDAADLMCKLDEKEPEREAEVIRELRPITFQLLLLAWKPGESRATRKAAAADEQVGVADEKDTGDGKSRW